MPQPQPKPGQTGPILPNTPLHRLMTKIAEEVARKLRETRETPPTK